MGHEEKKQSRVIVTFKFYFFSILFTVCLIGNQVINAQIIEIRTLDFTPVSNPESIKMDTAHGNLWIASKLDSTINLQFIDKTSLLKVKEINIPLNLGKHEYVADFDILYNDHLIILLKTFTQASIDIKYIKIDGPGLINNPKTLLHLTNQHLNLVIEEKNIYKSVNEQVSLELSANQKYFVVVNKQSLVCNIDDKGLEITSFNDQLKLQNTFQESNCAFKDIHIFNSGKIAISKLENEKIKFDLYEAHFSSLIYHYQFPEITKKTLTNSDFRSDTFDQQVQFVFDDEKQKVYGFIKGFINNIRITHIGLFVYDIGKQAAVLVDKGPFEIKSFIQYSISYRDLLQEYSYEYPMHLHVRYIKEIDNKYEIVADYVSYGSMPLGKTNAGIAQSMATYLIQLGDTGELISTDILLHKQSIINYSGRQEQLKNVNSTAAYEINKDNVNTQIGQLYLYNNSINYVIHNEDKKSFYSAERLYKYTYFGKDGKVAVIAFTPDSKKKEAIDSLANYTLLPMQSSYNLSKEQVVTFALEKKTVKLLSLSLGKP